MTRASEITKKIKESSFMSDLLTDVDCLIVGAGPAGLTAGIYLGRYLRKTLVVDGGNPRASWIPTSHNFPGWPQGVHGNDLLLFMREQCLKYGAEIESGRVTSITGRDGLFKAIVNGRIVTARKVLIATGIRNLSPTCIPEDVRARGTEMRQIRWCPICDPPEIGVPIAVIGSYDHGVREALFMHTYTDDITIIPVTKSELTSEDLSILTEKNIRHLESPLASVVLGSQKIICKLEDGSEEQFRCIYPSLGSTVHNDLLKQLDCTLDSTGCSIITDHCMTSIPGVYSAGDVTSALDQIDVACAQASVAATDMHNKLRQEDSTVNKDKVQVPIKGGLTNH